MGEDKDEFRGAILAGTRREQNELETADSREALEDSRKFLEKLDEEGDAYQMAYIRQLHEQNQDLKSNRELRERFGREAFKYLWALSSLVFVVILLGGFGGAYGFFDLDSIVLTTLAGGTFASAVGLVLAVINGLFKPVANSKGK